MGIEPFLLVFIVAAMFVVQAGRALVGRLSDRLEFSEDTRRGVHALAARHHMLPDRESGSWLSGRDGLDVQVWFDRYPGWRAQRILLRETGVRQREIGEHLAWLAPSVLVIVRFPAALVPDLRVSPRSQIVAEPDRLDLHSPVLQHILRVRGAPDHVVRRLISNPGVHEPLMELLGRHPLSVITERAVAVWCTRPVDDPEPLVDLAVEAAVALRTAASSTPMR